MSFRRVVPATIVPSVLLILFFTVLSNVAARQETTAAAKLGELTDS